MKIQRRAKFFFSSRRRHTRSLCDWSSDVCSSDLIAVGAVLVLDWTIGLTLRAQLALGIALVTLVPLVFFRSEERRVGKEWRCRCALTKLKREANGGYGFSAKRTLQIAEAIYERQN